MSIDKKIREGEMGTLILTPGISIMQGRVAKIPSAESKSYSATVIARDPQSITLDMPAEAGQLRGYTLRLHRKHVTDIAYN